MGKQCRAAFVKRWLGNQEILSLAGIVGTDKGEPGSMEKQTPMVSGGCLVAVSAPGKRRGGLLHSHRNTDCRANQRMKQLKHLDAGLLEIKK